MEWWSNGVMEAWSSSSTPALQHSNTPFNLHGGGLSSGCRGLHRGLHRRRRRFGFFDQPQGGVVQVAQLRFARFVAGEFDQVAALEEFAETVLLVGRQQIGFTQFVEELFSGALGR